MNAAFLARRGLAPKPLAMGLAAVLATAAAARIDAVPAPRAHGADFAFHDRVPSQPPAHRHRIAQILPVTSCADDGSAGTLRVVLAGAGDGDTVDLGALTCGTITLTQGAVTTAVDNVEIHGPGRDLLTIDGAHADRVVVLSGAGTLGIADVTIVDGYLAGDYNGGCVRSYGNLALTRTTISGCAIAA
ncbi:MAG TPA: hypothetical protein VKB52_14405, partial [Rhodanobacteraceae bacterium]|nr:hypothetical protein [Rhodanobacteraceae bacterium]